MLLPTTTCFMMTPHSSLQSACPDNNALGSILVQAAPRMVLMGLCLRGKCTSETLVTLSLALAFILTLCQRIGLLSDNILRCHLVQKTWLYIFLQKKTPFYIYQAPFHPPKLVVHSEKNCSNPSGDRSAT